jgi:hypothetical protein
MRVGRPPSFLTRRCARIAVLAAYYRDLDQESLAVPHPHRRDRRALHFDNQVPGLVQRPNQLAALIIEGLGAWLPPRAVDNR